MSSAAHSRAFAPPISRPAPSKRWLSLEQLLTWSYRAQLAHQKIQGPIDIFRFFADAADLLMNPADRRHLHIDALIVHEAVTALGTEIAAMVIAAALFGDWPEWMDEDSPRPYPVEPSDRYDDHGWYVDGNGIRREYLIRTAEVVTIARQEYVVSGRKKMKAANDNGVERVPVDYAVIAWKPEPERIAVNNRMVVQWEAARPVLIAALRDQPGEPRFKDHVLCADPVPLVAISVAANDNEPGAANDNESAQDEAAA